MTGKLYQICKYLPFFWKRKAKAKVIRLTKILDWFTRTFRYEFEENFVKKGTVNFQENQRLKYEKAEKVKIKVENHFSCEARRGQIMFERF